MTVLEFVIWYAVFVFSTTVHEFGHAATAHWAGDSTAHAGGQVSLDPMPHIRREPFGMVILPILAFVMSQGQYLIGYASAPFNPRWAERNPSKYALMSAAGPLGNFVLASVAFILIVVLVGAGVFRLENLNSMSRIIVAPGASAMGPMGAIAMFLSVMLSLNVILGVFNLLPIPPLDGAGVLEGAFPKSAGAFYQKMRTQPMMGFLGLIIAWNLFPYVYRPVLYFVKVLLLKAVV